MNAFVREMAEQTESVARNFKTGFCGFYGVLWTPARGCIYTNKVTNNIVFLAALGFIWVSFFSIYSTVSVLHTYTCISLVFLHT